MKLIFVEKNDAQISGFAVVKKVQIRSTERCAEIFLK